MTLSEDIIYRRSDTSLPWIFEMAIGLQENEISDEMKNNFMDFFEKVENLKNLLLEKKAEKSKGVHVCNYCGEEYITGRQLGGHISRKHQHNTFEYQVKK